MLTVRLATSVADIRAVQRLRYDVFVREMGASGPTVDHTNRVEGDRFDPVMDHLMLCDGDAIVGAYRMMGSTAASRLGGFYSASEFDLSALNGRNCLELGRSCVASEYRNGVGLSLMWKGLANYVVSRGYDYLFGVASFAGTDLARLENALGYLFQHHTAQDDLCPVALNVMASRPQMTDRKSAVLQLPALIKSYLRVGAMVGDGYFVDHEFNTTDVCLVLDVAQSREKHGRYFPVQAAE